MTPPAVLVMAKAPVPGLVKTRLEPVFTAEECAELQAALIRRTARWAVEVARADAFLAYDPPVDLIEPLVPPELKLFPQRGAHLGERLRNATAEAFAARSDDETPLLVVGVDTRLTPEHATQALDHLANGADVALGPALDGGYYLAALARPAPGLFAIDPAAWGGPEVLDRTLAAAAEAGLRTALLGPERDLDTPADAERLTGDPELGELLGRALARGRAQA